MSFGYQRQPQAMLNDTVVLDAYLYNRVGDALLPAEDIIEVLFTIVAPGDDPLAPTVEGAVGLVTEDGHAQYVADSNVNGFAGDYKVVAQFTYNEDQNFALVKSVPITYTIVDPFVETGPSPADGAVRQCWTFLEDCFDSDLGGPWLRDMTLSHFDESKLRAFVPQVLMEINNQMPFSSHTEDSFPWASDGQALFALGLLVQTEKHLMRSYTEQPMETGSPVLWQDRTRYQSAWKVMYDMDSAEFKHWLNRWKLQTYNLSSGALLIGTKAGRMLPAPMRSRNAGFGF